MKNKELEDYYGSFFELFTLPGWKNLVEQVQTTVDQLNQIRTIRDHRDLDFRQGQLDALTTLLNFEASIRQTMDTLEADENAV